MPATSRALLFLSLLTASTAACLGAEYVPFPSTNEGDGGGSTSSSSSSSGNVGNEEGGSSVDGGSITPPVNNDGGSSGDGAVTPPTNRKRVFITTNTTTGKLPGLNGGDNFCNTAATQAQAGGNWVAFLSVPGANAIDRLSSDGPWFSMDRQTLLFTGKRTGTSPISGLGPAAAINQNELGQTYTANTLFWTGTKQGGVVSNAHCESWSNDNVNPFASGTVGSSTKIDQDWVGASTPYTCYGQMHILCFEL